MYKRQGGGNKGTDLPIDSWELYDLKADPMEINNVYSDPLYAGIVADLKKRLADKRAELKIEQSESTFDLEAWKRKAQKK